MIIVDIILIDLDLIVIKIIFYYLINFE